MKSGTPVSSAKRNGAPHKQRQGKLAEKSRWNVMLTDDNYDFLLKLADEDGISMGAMLNRILLEMRRRENVPQSTFVTS